jgi:hypothetical protein
MTARKRADSARDERGANRSIAADVLTGAEIQRSIDADAVLLQYELGQRRSFVWVVTRDSVRVGELAPSDTIEAAARAVLLTLQTSTSAARRSTDSCRSCPTTCSLR